MFYYSKKMLEYIKKLYAWIMLIKTHRQKTLILDGKTTDKSVGFIIHLTHVEKRKNLSIPIEDLFHNKKLLNKFNVDDIIEIGRLYARYKFTKDK